MDPIDGLGVSEAVADVRIVEIASAGLGECRAAIGHFTGANNADMTDAMRVFPYGNGRLALVGGALGFSRAEACRQPCRAPCWLSQSWVALAVSSRAPRVLGEAGSPLLLTQ